MDDSELDTTSTTILRIPTCMTVVPVCTTFQAESNSTRLIEIVQAVFEIIGLNGYLCNAHKVYELTTNW